MWLHIVIFVILLLLTVCSTLGWIHVENIGTVKGRKMFLVVALAGNITGGLPVSYTHLTLPTTERV